MGGTVSTVPFLFLGKMKRGLSAECAEKRKAKTGLAGLKPSAYIEGLAT